MSSNSTDALLHDFWQQHLLPLASELRAQARDPLSKSPGGWQAPPKFEEFAADVQGAEPLDTLSALQALWKDDPRLLALLEPLQHLARALAAERPSDPATQVSEYQYVMF